MLGLASPSASKSVPYLHTIPWSINSLIYSIYDKVKILTRCALQIKVASYEPSHKLKWHLKDLHKEMD